MSAVPAELLAAEVLVSVLLVAVLLLVMCSIWIGVVRTGISPMPSSKAARERVLSLVSLPGAGPIFELGSGWGSLAIPLARNHPNRQVRCFEVSTVPWLVSSLRVRWSGLQNLEVSRGDFHRFDLGEAAVVVCYLFPEGMVRLVKKLESELSSDAVVVSNTFAVPGWTPDTTLEVGDRHRSRVYRYRGCRPGPGVALD